MTWNSLIPRGTDCTLAAVLYTYSLFFMQTQRQIWYLLQWHYMRELEIKSRHGRYLRLITLCDYSWTKFCSLSSVMFLWDCAAVVETGYMSHSCLWSVILSSPSHMVLDILAMPSLPVSTIQHQLWLSGDTSSVHSSPTKGNISHVGVSLPFCFKDGSSYKSLQAVWREEVLLLFSQRIS